MNTRTLMRQRFEPGAWALMFEVANSTGAGAARYADALALSLWPSRGLELLGFEFKASRGDWKRELENPAKAEKVCQFCDRWWIVAPAEAVKLDELPPTWGWLEKKPDTLRVRKEAPKLEPKPWPRSFLAAMLRRSCQEEQATIDALVDAKLAPMEASLRARLKQDAQYERDKTAKALLKLRDIEQRCGIDLTSWEPTDAIVQAIKTSLASGVFAQFGGLLGLRDEVRRHAERVEKMVSVLGLEEQKTEKVA